ncbi:unnamed protein product [Dracunculus medinensis]|uniref:Signal peptidase complex subunit 2 n=1 Tax=Dracunculus medinensis TaxID=318479 RepID=A0A0N4U6F5_DRAME|nr:unnamed protein product [Dracunculus medinensis]
MDNEELLMNVSGEIKFSSFKLQILNRKSFWTEKHYLADIRLLISTIAVFFSAFAFIYDYLEPFPKSKPVLATCSITYFILMGILQLYMWYVEKGTFFQAVEEDYQKRHPKRYWKWSSSIKKFDDKYTLEAEYTQESLSGQTKVIKSIGCFIDEDGYVVMPLLEKEVEHLINNVLRKD